MNKCKLQLKWPENELTEAWMQPDNSQGSEGFPVLGKKKKEKQS